MSLRFLIINFGWLVLHLYVIVRLLYWTRRKLRLWMFFVGAGADIFSTLITISYLAVGHNWPQWPLRMSFIWMGWLLLAVVSVAAFEIPRQLLRKVNTRYWATGALAMSLGLAILASILARTITVRHESMSVAVDRPVRLVHMADLHLGHTGDEHTRGIVEQINALAADMVVISGDVIDHYRQDEFDRLELLNGIKAPIVFTDGNHEGYAGLERVAEKLKDTRFDIVSGGSYVELPGTNVRIFGVGDSYSESEFAQRLKSFTLDDTGGVDVLSVHRPKAPQLAADKGFELMLSGHTHAGQIMPFGLAVRMEYPYFFGVYQVDDMLLNVTAGAGYWGPPMRFPRPCEIVCIDLKPSETMVAID